MFIRADICGLNGAGCALASPYSLSAAPGRDHTAPAMKTASASRSGNDFRCMVPPLKFIPSNALQRALGLEGDFWIRIGHGPPDDTSLLVAILAARNLDVVRIGVGSEPRHLVGAERVRPRHDAEAVLERDGDFCIRNGRAGGIPDEAEIGGPR